jgi:signal transduction histidine kinase
VAIVRHDLFDIDRLVSATAAYSMALIALMGAAALLIPALAARLASQSGVTLQTALLGVVIVLAAVGFPLATRLRPHLEGLFFPERRALARGLDRLMSDISLCRSPRELHELVADRLAGLLHPESCVLFSLESELDEALTPRVLAGAARVPALERSGGLARALERQPFPLRTEPDALRRSAPDAGPQDLEAIAACGAEVLVPLRAGKDLTAVLALAAKRSGDVFTAEELARLQAVAEKASAELSRMRAEVSLEAERERGDQLHQAKEAAELANAIRSRFLAAASHDLRQPLHALGLFVERLAAAPHAPDPVLVTRIAESTRALTVMFDALLDLSRLEAGVVEPELSSFDLEPLLERLAAEFEALARAKDLALRVELAPARVESDPLLLGRILQNLLANAVRYTREGQVTLRSRQQGAQLWIEVEDTGPGIPAQARTEIFREFVRLAPAGGERGLGLGLSIVERTARLLGHPLELDSQPGRGSRFRISVPLARQPAAAAVVSRERVADTLAGRVVVVIDDDPAVLEASHGLLESWGCEPVLADGLDAARESLRLRGRPPEAVVADYRLRGDETGVQAVRALRREWGEALPVVLVSGESDPVRLRPLRESGLPWLRKPLQPAKLRAVLQELLRAAGGRSDSGAEVAPRAT